MSYLEECMAPITATQRQEARQAMSKDGPAIAPQWLQDQLKAQAETAVVTNAHVSRMQNGMLVGEMNVRVDDAYIKLRTTDGAFNEDSLEIGRLHVILNRISGALCDAATVTIGDENSYEGAIRGLTKERDEWKAKAERYHFDKLQAESGFLKQDEIRSSKLSDACGALRTENSDLLKENAQLRRKIEKLEHKK